MMEHITWRLFYEVTTILSYLSPFHALNAFFNLNCRLNRLLTLFQRQIDLTHLSYKQFKHYIDILLPIVNKHQSLSIIKLGNIRTFSLETRFSTQKNRSTHPNKRAKL